MVRPVPFAGSAVGPLATVRGPAWVAATPRRLSLRLPVISVLGTVTTFLTTPASVSGSPTPALALLSLALATGIPLALATPVITPRVAIPTTGTILVSSVPVWRPARPNNLVPGRRPTHVDVSP